MVSDRYPLYFIHMPIEGVTPIIICWVRLSPTEYRILMDFTQKLKQTKQNKNNIRANRILTNQNKNKKHTKNNKTYILKTKTKSKSEEHPGLI